MSAPAFIDEAAIDAEGGRGGDGAVSFSKMRGGRRNARGLIRGKPDGGDGGRGGNVVALADSNVASLIDFRTRRRIVAGRGKAGGSGDSHGASGADEILHLPVGTAVIDGDIGALHADLIEDGIRVILAAGGIGGLGNARFKSSVNRSPQRSTAGEEGESRRFRLELKLPADVGLVGMPNAGKSLLLRAISAARPRVADYPFTTVAPTLGFVAPDNFDLENARESFIVADIPGLIRGASSGAGLGSQFLRHIFRASLLFYVIDSAAANPLDDFAAVADELHLESLDKKPRWIVLNKIDLAPFEERKKIAAKFESAFPQCERIFLVSAKNGEGCATLIDEAAKRLAQPNRPQENWRRMHA